MRVSSTLIAALTGLNELAHQFIAILFSRHSSTAWEIVTEQPYAFLDLNGHSGVELNGTPLGVGETPVRAAGNIFATRPAQNRVELADAEGLLECFKRHHSWARRCQRTLTAYNDIYPGLSVTSNGDLLFKIPCSAPVSITAGSTFSLTLPDGSAVVRVSTNGAIYKADRTGTPPSEYVVEGRLVFQRCGARSSWKYQYIGLPTEHNEKKVRSMEVAPGVTIHEGGSVEALHTLFLEGQPIDLQCGDLTLKRCGGIGEPLVIASRGVVIGVAFTHFAEWVKFVPISPEYEQVSWLRSIFRGNLIARWITNAEIATAEVPLLRLVHVVNAAVWRHAQAASNEPLLMLFGPLILIAKAVCVVIRYALLFTAIPISLVLRMTQHVNRTFNFTAIYWRDSRFGNKTS